MNEYYSVFAKVQKVCEAFILSFSLLKKKQKNKIGRFLRASHHFLENLCRRTKAPAEIFSENAVHLDTTSRPIKACTQLQNMF
jgi:hypothetical protein